MTARLFKAAEVCDMAQVQPYVLRSWEKEFPGIGVQKSPDGARLYRQADVEQVLRIKKLVFGEGLTLAGARRRLEESLPAAIESSEVVEVLEALSDDARTRIAHVKQGLRSILAMLDGTGDRVVVVNEDYELKPPAPPAGEEVGVAARAAAGTRRGRRATA